MNGSARVLEGLSSLRVRTVDEATAILDHAQITGMRRTQLLDLVRHVMNAAPDAGVSTDDLTGACGLSGRSLHKALADLETLGIASNDTPSRSLCIWGSKMPRRVVLIWPQGWKPT